MIAADILPLILLCIILYKGEIVTPFSKSINLDYLSLESGKALRGTFAIVIIYHHISQKTSQGLLLFRFANIGYLAVAFFFFLSGYGLMKRHVTDNNYLNGFIIKRLPSILLPYTLANLVYWLFYYFRGLKYSALDFVIRIMSGNPIAQNSWYIICIILFYIYFWLAMFLFKQRKLLMVLFSTVLCGVYAAACIKFQFGPWWYNSISLFPIGLFWAAYERQLLVLIRKTYPIFAPLIIILCFVLSHYQEVIVQYLPIPYASALLSNITAIFFGLSIIMVILKCKISNKILNYLGDHSLELYMYHGLFSIWAKPLLNNNRGLFLYAVVVLACSLVSAHLLQTVNQWVMKKYKQLLRIK